MHALATLSLPSAAAAFLYFYDTTYREPNEFGGGVKIDVAPGYGRHITITN